MAKWDLNKLPEGRKPLPDEWFAERAQMQDRIKELEKQLWWVFYEREATFVLMLNRAETAETKLEKAVGWFDEIRQHCANSGRGVPSIDERIVERCEDTAASAIAELTGGNND